ncbi:hypothetical protein T11_15468 [Trichinella zimbabwensis]|uniref:Uncharacterized protein n=1 Tax=Trichinella zimbabwensis TaxID=268475 RepID=A0A0V1GXN1_9BILA|nr:hypothetical protein T11_15468 [Trichinella zimbabwensis]
MKTSWEKLADIDDNIEQQLELASNPTIPLVRVVPFRRMRSSTIAGTVAESLESSLDSYRRQNNQTIIYFNFNIINNTTCTNGFKTNYKIHRQVAHLLLSKSQLLLLLLCASAYSNASSPVHTSAEFTRSRNRVFCSDPSILLKVDKDLLPEISTPGLKHHHLPIIQERKLSNFSASEGFLQPNRNFMSASSTPPLQSVASSSFSLFLQLLIDVTKIFATHHSESFAADRTSTVKECSGPAHRLRDKFAASGVEIASPGNGRKMNDKIGLV